MTEPLSWAVMGPHVRGRSCGSCTACCTQVPVELVKKVEVKPANVRCKHLCSKGCRIYETRPEPCEYWSCRWLFDANTAGLKRPDIGGYIVDCMPDTILANGNPFDVIQVWIDPKRRDAHRAPELRAYIDWCGATYGLAAIVRYSNSDCFTLVPPSLSRDGWWELRGTLVGEGKIQAALDAAGYEGGITLSAEAV